MRCPQCGLLNPDTGLHCTGCGAALTDPGDAVPTMETDLQRELAAAQDAIRRLRHFIPSVVAESILHDQERLRGERREVAVLFADAVNFTRLSASLDAEPVFGLINDLLGRLVACIHRYDGLVDKFTGDGLMAVFGAPHAHENDAELAVRAALDMQKVTAEFEPIAHAQLGAPLQIRIGIHSGLVIAGILGTQQQAAYTVIGDTVNLAARLQALSQPGRTVVSSRVYEQTRPFFNFEAMGTAQIKGIDQPMTVYEVIGNRSEPLPTRGVAGTKTILLGRNAELQQLRLALAAFLDDQHGRVVTIQGEAGMGKSRLVSEWLSVIVPDQATVWQGRGLPYSQGVGYGVFRSLLQDALRTYPPHSTWDDKVTPALRPFLRQISASALTPEEQAALQRLEPERVKQLTELALREWLLGETRQRPVVLILEDFHWADDLSKDMLPSLVGLVRETPLLVCLISRPQPEAPLQIAFPQTKAPLAAPLFLSVELKPLSPEYGRALLGHLVNLNSLPEQFVNTILTRAEGNPFYIEEFVHMLIEKQVLTQGDDRWQVASTVELETLEVPTTLRGLMMARVDRLPQDLQHVLRDAAVIGLQFSASLLDEVERRLHGTVNVLPMLERLTQMGLLVKRPGAGDPMHGFRHIITQETIYDGLMHSQRPMLHRAVAECIETLYAADVNSQAEVLALHYHRAHVRDKAMHYALQAGDRGRQRFANHEAIEHYSLALQLSQHLSGCEAERWQAAIGLGEVQQHIGQYEEATALYRAALEEWKEAAPQARAQVMLKLGQVWDKQGDASEAEGWLRQALTHLSRADVPHPELQAQLYSELGWLSLRRGDLVAAQDWLEQGLALVSDTEHYDVLSSILNRLGAVHFNRSEWERAAKCVERALELRQRLGDVVGYARSLNNLGILKQASGDWDGALADYERSVESNERIGEIEGLALACTNLGVLYTDRGEWAKAEENLLRSFAIAQQIAHSYELAQAHMNLGGLCLLQERWTDCARHLGAAIPLYEQVGAHANLNLNDAYDLQSKLALEQGQLDAALEWARRSHDLLRQVTETDDGESVEWGRYEQLMGRIAQAQGDLTTASHHLEKSAVIFGQAHSRLDAGRTAYWSALLSLEMHQLDQACDKLSMARQIFERLGAAADLRRVQQHLTQLAEQT